MTLIDLYAINIIENGYSFAKVPTILKTRCLYEY